MTIAKEELATYEGVKEYLQDAVAHLHNEVIEAERAAAFKQGELEGLETLLEQIEYKEHARLEAALVAKKARSK